MKFRIKLIKIYLISDFMIYIRLGEINNFLINKKNAIHNVILCDNFY